MTVESDAVTVVAGLMALAARTAPKAAGRDSVQCRVVTGKEQDKLAERIDTMGEDLGLDFFAVNAGQVRKRDTTLLIGVGGTKALGLNCGGCRYPTVPRRQRPEKRRRNESRCTPARTASSRSLISGSRSGHVAARSRYKVRHGAGREG
jgi:uncharacterized ferredoxin-like protein